MVILDKIQFTDIEKPRILKILGFRFLDSRLHFRFFPHQLVPTEVFEVVVTPQGSRHQL